VYLSDCGQIIGFQKKRSRLVCQLMVLGGNIGKENKLSHVTLSFPSKRLELGEWDLEMGQDQEIGISLGIILLPRIHTVFHIRQLQTANLSWK